MNSGLRISALLLMAAGALPAQTLSNAILNGKYFARHVQFTTDSNGAVTDARSITGAIHFNGAGGYTFTGQQVAGSNAVAAYSASGQYTLSAAGVVSMTNPQRPQLQLNARYSAEAIAGSSTESAANTFDFFIAIPAPSAAVSTGTLSGSYFATDFELTGGTMAQVRNSFVSLAADGAGNFPTATALGHAANLNGTALTQTLSGATYALTSDGTGTATFPFPAGLAQGTALLGSAVRTLQVSASGNLVIGATPGAHDLFLAVKAITGGTARNSSVAPSLWLAGLRADPKGGSSAYAGSRRTGAAAFVSSRRLNYLNAAAPLNETDTVSFTVAADGSGSAGASKLGLGAGGSLVALSAVSGVLDPSGYEIGFCMAVSQLTGTGVFLNPLGVVNAASGAPALDAISPGEFIGLYGTGLAAAAKSALPPYPASVGGVSVTIGGLQAPVYFVSANQLNVLVPYGVTGSSATVVVTNNGVQSNTVTVPLAGTSPGIFTLDSSGTSDGAILHGDYSLVNAASPAKKGEIVSMYLTGLGALTNPVADGFGATAVNAAKTPLQVLVNGLTATVSYAGLSVLPGLYQINFQIPAILAFSGQIPVAILTPDAFHDQVTIAVQ